MTIVIYEVAIESILTKEFPHQTILHRILWNITTYENSVLYKVKKKCMLKYESKATIRKLKVHLEMM